MYSFELTGQFISEKERAVFRDFQHFYGIDEGVWEVFECLFNTRCSHITCLASCSHRYIRDVLFHAEQETNNPVDFFNDHKAFKDSGAETNAFL